MTIRQDMRKSLDALAAADLLRRERTVSSSGAARIVVDGRELLNLSGNDYLALAADPAVKAAASEAIGRWGVGSGASRLVSGTTSLHVELERRLAEFKGAAAAVVTSTGWMANRAAIHALVGGGDLVLADKLDHASIIDAARSCGARLRTYTHCDMQRLEQLLRRHRAGHRRCLIVTDSLFSMDGDFAPLRKLVELRDRFDAQLLIDEAHATGVIGDGGRGVAELTGVENRIDATVGTLSKAIGTLGGFITGSSELIETVRNTARAYIYTTALPAAICAAAVAALDIIRDQPLRRENLLAEADELRRTLKADGMDIGNSTSQIFPVLIGSAGEALFVSEELFERGFFAPAIRPPTVPRGAARLRISVTAAHSRHDLAEFAVALKEVRATN